MTDDCARRLGPPGPVLRRHCPRVRPAPGQWGQRAVGPARCGVSALWGRRAEGSGVSRPSTFRFACQETGLSSRPRFPPDLSASLRKREWLTTSAHAGTTLRGSLSAAPRPPLVSSPSEDGGVRRHHRLDVRQGCSSPHCWGSGPCHLAIGNGTRVRPQPSGEHAAPVPLGLRQRRPERGHARLQTLGLRLGPLGSLREQETRQVPRPAGRCPPGARGREPAWGPGPRGRVCWHMRGCSARPAPPHSPSSQRGLCAPSSAVVGAELTP